MNHIRKLDVGHWNVGKGCKGTRKAKIDRAFEAEIAEQLAELDENYRTKHISTGTPNHLARLEYRIEWYTQTLARYDLEEKNGYRDSFAHYLRDGLKKAQAQLQEMKERHERLRT
jgi:hypothetical protein